MDFDALKAEIESKKRSLAGATGTQSSGNPPPKYVKRGDLERAKEAQLLQEQADRERQRLTSIQENLIRQQEIIKKELEVKEKEQERDGRGAETETNAEMSNESEKASPTKLKGASQVADEMSISAMETEPISREQLARDPDKVQALIILFFKRLLREWRDELAAQSAEYLRSRQGQTARTSQAQTVDGIKPLFKQLRAKTLPKDVLLFVVEICHWMQARDYVKALDFYLRLSIGNAPWPIGVTMVAHVLNDETQRKWIQSMKRLMTFCQNKYPPSDLARAVG